MRRQKEIEKEKKVEMTAQKNEKIEGKSGSAERNKRMEELIKILRIDHRD